MKSNPTPQPILTQPYDLIGDIHGHAAPLEALLLKLGYAEAGSTWRHPEGRQIIFLGDYVDRGPAIRRVLQIVRDMVDAGDALAIMGNHEYNAILYHLPDGHGDYLRPRWEKNIKQHGATLTQFADHPDEWTDYLAWFATLPIWMDLGGLRTVHATWDNEGMLAHPEWRVPGLEWIVRSAVRESEECLFAEKVLKGVEIPLPEGYFFTDKEEIDRDKIRVRWWLPFEGRTYHDLCLPESDTVPRFPVTETEATAGLGYPEDGPPVFFGHYWFPYDGNPRPLAPNLACLDYSVAKENGALAAYRWDGEQILDPAKFVHVKTRLGIR